MTPDEYNTRIILKGVRNITSMTQCRNVRNGVFKDWIGNWKFMQSFLRVKNYDSGSINYQYMVDGRYD